LLCQAFVAKFSGRKLTVLWRKLPPPSSFVFMVEVAGFSEKNGTLIPQMAWHYITKTEIIYFIFLIVVKPLLV